MTTDIEPYSMMQPLLAASESTILSWPTSGQLFWFLLSCTFFLLLNAFFVASEFAIVKVRPSQIETLAETKPVKAARARRVIENLDAYLSANQLGITLASLGLAIFSEPFIDQSLTAIFLMGFKDWFNVDWFIPGSTGARIVGYSSHAVTLAFFTVFHVVIGELIPKAIAIRKSLAVTLALAPILHLFYVTFSPLIFVLNGAANFCLKHIFRIDPVKEGEHAHSSEELALLVAESGENQEVTDTEREILINALELNDVYVKDVMTPRSEVIMLDVDEEFTKNLEEAALSKHTRFPLVKGHLDNTVGLIHIKDILSLIGQEDPDLMSIKRDIKEVPHTMPLDVLLKFFQKEHEHLAMVVNEFGEPAGLVFLDNVIEELVGDIQDEFDEETESFSRINDEEFVCEGNMTLNWLYDYVPELDLDGEGVSTIGGYITQKLERFPEVGEMMRIEEYEVTIESIAERRVGQLRFRKLSDIELDQGEAVAV